MMGAVGYIRKSVVHDSARMLSPETQEAAIRSLARRFGDDDVVIYSDLDISGTKKRDRRPGWDTLLTAVESGQASAVYGYSLSRFARSVTQLSAFFDLCKERRVAIRVDRDQIDTSTASGELIANVLASLAQFEASAASERVRDAFAVKRARDPGWKGPGNLPFGDLPGEDCQPVLDAFRAAGSFDGAARRLNSLGVPCRSARAVWHGSMVRAVVRRLAPELVAPETSRGSKAAPQPFRLARILACSVCGTRLTASRDPRTAVVRYYCHRAKVLPHPRGWVSEHLVLPAVAAEAERAALAVNRLQVGSAEDDQRIAALAAKRERVLANFEDGLIDRVARDVKLRAIAEDEGKLSARRWIRRISIPPDVAGSDPRRVNEHLRRIFERVTVDFSQPAQRGPSRWAPGLEYMWRDPEMRVA